MFIFNKAQGKDILARKPLGVVLDICKHYTYLGYMLVGCIGAYRITRCMGCLSYLLQLEVYLEVYKDALSRKCSADV